MASADGTARLLARLETTLDGLVAGRDAAVLAFSGGLSSLVLAGLLRKRLDLSCVVVGTPAAPDLRAARRAAEFLDYRVTEVRLSQARALSLVRRAVGLGSLPVRQALEIAPVTAVAEAKPGELVVAGFGSRERALPWPILEGIVDLPWRSLPGGRGLPRPRIQALAREIGIPEPFVRTRMRSPAVGSGIESALRSFAGARGLPLRRLIRRSRAYD